MKSSVRILAIALALAFLLLARTAFQDTTSAKEHIDLKDGEASFADPINGLNEANYLGFGDKATTTVYFYIEERGPRHAGHRQHDDDAGQCQLWRCTVTTVSFTLPVGSRQMQLRGTIATTTV